MKVMHSVFVVLGGFSASLLASEAAMALPRKGVPLRLPKNLPLVESSENYDFNGITKLSNCSGALVRFENSLPNDKAMMMTNGHCVETAGGFIKPNQYLKDTKDTRSFRFLKSNGELGSGSVKGTKILYATMTGTDLALYEVNATYAEIVSKFDVDALTISKDRPDRGQNIEILSGYWLRGYSCQIDNFVFELKEDKYSWKDSIRYSSEGCKTIHGTSGSPIIDPVSRKVIGINNTGNDSGERCTMDNPCEVSASGEVTYSKGVSYGQQTYIVYSCLDDAGKIDLQKAGCQLFH